MPKSGFDIVNTGMKPENNMGKSEKTIAAELAAQAMFGDEEALHNLKNHFGIEGKDVLRWALEDKHFDYKAYLCNKFVEKPNSGIRDELEALGIVDIEEIKRLARTVSFKK